MARTLNDHGEWKEPKNVGCLAKQLPLKAAREAALRAVDIFPGNAPQSRGLSKYLSEEARAHIATPQAQAVMTTKYWGPKRRTLGVSFMETTAPELRDLIISHMNAWYDLGCCIDFKYSQSNGEVRISRGRGGYYSYLGPDILGIPKGQQTMNLEGFVLKTPLSEYKRVVRHETGHTLGFPHEHMRRDIVALLDRKKTIDYFGRNQGWSEQEVLEQVLTPIEEKELLEPPPADAFSIMCYQLPGSITKDGRPIPGGLDIDEVDAKYCRKIYPRADVPSSTTTVTTTSIGSVSVPAGAVTLDPVRKKILYMGDWEVQKVG